MKTILAILVVLIGCHIATAEEAKTAALQKEHCEQYAAARSGARGSQRQAEAGSWCFAYLRGMKDAMDGDLSWADDLHKQVVVGVWSDNVSVDQLIRVFLKYANANPENSINPHMPSFARAWKLQDCTPTRLPTPPSKRVAVPCLPRHCKPLPTVLASTFGRG